MEYDAPLRAARKTFKDKQALRAGQKELCVAAALSCVVIDFRRHYLHLGF
jgi:hypothetical protein